MTSKWAVVRCSPCCEGILTVMFPTFLWDIIIAKQVRPADYGVHSPAGHLTRHLRRPPVPCGMGDMCCVCHTYVYACPCCLFSPKYTCSLSDGCQAAPWLHSNVAPFLYVNQWMSSQGVLTGFGGGAHTYVRCSGQLVLMLCRSLVPVLPPPTLPSHSTYSRAPVE